jgi:hypothetical protein
MPALSRLPAAQGIAAMQSINVAVITPSFMGALFGTAAAHRVDGVEPRPDGRGPGRSGPAHPRALTAVDAVADGVRE